MLRYKENVKIWATHINHTDSLFRNDDVISYK